MFKKILSALLICAMLLSIFVACKQNTATPEASTEAPAEEVVENTDISIITGGKLNVRVIYSFMEVAKNDALDAKVNNLISTVQSKTGIKIKALNSSATEYDPNALDIYIGSTGYPESVAAAENLRLKDYSITRSGNKIVLVGGSPDTLATAVNVFTSKVLTPQFKEYSGEVVFTEANVTLYNAKYTADSVLVGDVELKNFTLVIPKEYKMAEHEIAYMLKDVIASKYGYDLPVEYDNKTYDHEILIGNTARTTIAQPNLTEYVVEVTDKNVQILAGCTTAYDYIDDLFSTQFLPQCKVNTVKTDAKADYEKNKDSILGTTSDLRVIFHNVYGSTDDGEKYTNPTLRWNLSSNLYTEYEADVLCFQEFNNLPREGINSLKSRLQKLGYQEVPLSGYTRSVTYIDGNQKNGIASWSITKGGSSLPNTPIFYNPETVELVKYGDYVFTSSLTKEEINALYTLYGDKLGTRYDSPTTPDKASEQYWGYELYNDNVRYSGLSKSTVWAIFKDKETGKLFAVASVHLDHQDTCYSNARREKQSQELLNVINNTILTGDYANIPVIFGGDVNTSYNRELNKYYKQNNTPTGAIQNFEAAGYKDVQSTLAGADQSTTCVGNASFDKNKNYFTSFSTTVGSASASIDHCFYQGAITPTLFDVMNHSFARRTSDHMPLVVDFKFQ